MSTDLDDALSDELGVGLVVDELDESCLVLLDGRSVVQLGDVLDRFEQAART